MIGHGQKFGRKKEQAMAALLSHRSLEEAAKAVGISLATLKRWMRLPEFRAEFLQARRQSVQQANARIQQNSGAAASVLLKLMFDGNMPAAVRARAAQIVLDRANQSLETDDLEMRITRLEALQKERQ
jgi:hypothetical protein